MSNLKFRVGDRVMVTRRGPRHLRGWRGRVTGHRSNNSEGRGGYIVEWDLGFGKSVIRGTYLEAVGDDH